MKLTILTAVRSNETRLATWGEFDLDAATWSIPAARMKMKQPHVVPLAPAAVALLRRLRTEHQALTSEALDERLLFSARADKPISDVTMLKAIRDMKIKTVTVHGFRSSFWRVATQPAAKIEADERSVYYLNCDAARAAGAAPIYRGTPGYREGIDSDGDGIACEPYR